MLSSFSLNYFAILRIIFSVLRASITAVLYVKMVLVRFKEERMLACLHICLQMQTSSLGRGGERKSPCMYAAGYLALRRLTPLSISVFCAALSLVRSVFLASVTSWSSTVTPYGSEMGKSSLNLNLRAHCYLL
jgi:hypothetical protein